MRKAEDVIMVFPDDYPMEPLIVPDLAPYTGTGHIRTFTGKMVDPFNMRQEDVNFADVVNSLSQMNRFTGHATRPYSVAEHTLNLYDTVPKHLRKVALVHEWAESYFNDMASPVKRNFPEYKKSEKKAQHMIYEMMGISKEEDMEFDEYDKRICSNEMLALFDPPYVDYETPLPDVCISPFDHNWRSIRNRFATVLILEFPGLITPQHFKRFTKETTCQTKLPNAG